MEPKSSKRKSDPTNRGSPGSIIGTGLVAIGLIALFLASPVQAGSHTDCAAYSNTAVKQQRKNMRQGCGFSGPRWHTNKQGHYAWCRIARSRTARKETAGRKRNLNTCLANNNINNNNNNNNNNNHRNARLELKCEDHARIGIDAQKTNEALTCDLDGRKWTRNFDKHFDWCMRKSRSRRNRRQSKWRSAIRECVDNQDNGNDGGRQANSCGWYVILTCHGSRRKAERSLKDFGGSGVGGGAGTHVINTDNYDGFRNGWYCLADGPYDRRGQASGVAWKEYYPSAYVKEGCRQ